MNARNNQIKRQQKTNAHLSTKEMGIFCAPNAEGEALLRQAMNRLKLSARAYHRILRVARTISDIANSADILPMHIAEAIQYRRYTEN